MKFYIAGHDQRDCRYVAKLLKDAGHTITSTWLYLDFVPTSRYSHAEKREIAVTDTREILDSDAVVITPSPYRVPGGKFVEAGIAIGAGKVVFALGSRENMLMWHPSVHLHASVEELIEHLAP